jgi:uncharacterized Zn-binding protein involved in type VI secretion
VGNDVFANGRELACKSGSGKSICAFPDVCMTPPENPATPPGVPVPYPNTGMASDTTSGSQTVKISGKEVMLKNKSYFKSSTGDEAGAAAKKGLVSSVNRGKVYFAAWSMDVKIEGENAVRHLDMTTHNHGSAPQTPPWPFADSAAVSPGGVCHDMEHLKLSPYKDKCPPGPNGEKITPHHLIADRCLRARGTKKSQYHAASPCICVKGTSQHKAVHRRCHSVFDPVEFAHHNKKFEYRTARYAAATSAGMALEPPRSLSEAEKACVEAQLDNFYKNDPNGPGLSDRDDVRAGDKRGKVNDHADEAAALFSS